MFSYSFLFPGDVFHTRSAARQTEELAVAHFVKCNWIRCAIDVFSFYDERFVTTIYLLLRVFRVIIIVKSSSSLISKNSNNIMGVAL